MQRLTKKSEKKTTTRTESKDKRWGRDRETNGRQDQVGENIDENVREHRDTETEQF